MLKDKRAMLASIVHEQRSKCILLSISLSENWKERETTGKIRPEADVRLIVFSNSIAAE